MEPLRELTALADERFAAYAASLGGAPHHRIEFSPRITRSWALIYYRRRLVRLSPYVFLLDRDELQHGTHWRELDATLRHEAVHAHLYATTGETGHSHRFHALLAHLGVRANGGCDLGPENAAHRYVYACSECGLEWRRRAMLHGNWSCGPCSPGRFDPRTLMRLREDLGPPVARLLARGDLVRAAVAEGQRAAGTLGPAATAQPRATASLGS